MDIDRPLGLHPWHDMTYHNISWHVMKLHNISWSFMTCHDFSWHFMTFYDISWCIMIYNDISWNFAIKIKNIIFVAKTRNYGIFVVKIYDYALIDSFWGSVGFIDNAASCAALVHYKITCQLSTPSLCLSHPWIFGSQEIQWLSSPHWRKKIPSQM